MRGNSSRERWSWGHDGCAGDSADPPSPLSEAALGVNALGGTLVPFLKRGLCLGWREEVRPDGFILWARRNWLLQGRVTFSNTVKRQLQPCLICCAGWGLLTTRVNHKPALSSPPAPCNLLLIPLVKAGGEINLLLKEVLIFRSAAVHKAVVI